MKKLIERFRKFTAEYWIRLGVMLFFTAILTYVTVGMIVSYANGNTLFGKSTAASDSFFKKNGDILMLILLIFLSVCMISIFIYTLFIKKTEEGKVVRKIVVNRKVIRVEDDRTQNIRPDKASKVKMSVPVDTGIPKEKLKEIEAKLKDMEKRKNQKD